jgi:cytochrome c553
MHRLLPLLIAMAALPARADDAAALRVRSLAAQCAACHGTEGHAVEGSLIAGLSGMPASYFSAQMKAFRSGARQGTVMPQLAKGFTPEQVEQLAAFFAAQRRRP